MLAQEFIYGLRDNNEQGITYNSNMLVKQGIIQKKHGRIKKQKFRGTQF